MKTIWLAVSLLLVALASALPGGLAGLQRSDPGLFLSFAVRSVDGAALDPATLDEVARVLDRRARLLGYDDAVVWTTDAGRVVVLLPTLGDRDAEVTIERFQTIGLIELVDAQGKSWHLGHPVQTSLNAPDDGAPTAEPVYETIVSSPDITGAHLTRDESGRGAIGYRLTPDGAERMTAFTSAHIGQTIAVVLDKLVLSTMTLDGVGGAEGLITGVAEDEVEPTVLFMNSGALPVPIELVERSEVHAVAPVPTAEPPPATPAAAKAGNCWDADDIGATAAGHPTFALPPRMTLDPAKSYTAVLETNLGTITIELHAEEAPLAVNNFVCLAQSGYYDGTTFHRVVAGFVIQGGDRTGTGSGEPGYHFADEPVTRDYRVGTLAMANAGPDTNGSQFFICLDALTELGYLAPNYTIFGQVIDGSDIVARIGAVPTKLSQFGEQSTPIEPVTIARVTILESAAGAT